MTAKTVESAIGRACASGSSAAVRSCPTIVRRLGQHLPRVPALEPTEVDADAAQDERSPGERPAGKGAEPRARRRPGRGRARRTRARARSPPPRRSAPRRTRARHRAYSPSHFTSVTMYGAFGRKRSHAAPSAPEHAGRRTAARAVVEQRARATNGIHARNRFQTRFVASRLCTATTRTATPTASAPTHRGAS